ncbi:MAG TPA: hypothetical protein VJR06_03755 [Nitrososphaerales archaeon]|nr:hypothetical protein [Nitrososphaerales archaeon]
MREKGASPAWTALALLIALGVLGAMPAGAAPHSLKPAVLSTVPRCMGLNGVNDSAIPSVVGSMRIALVQPILTATPYSQYPDGSFYAFYAKELGVTTDVTTDLNLLTTNVSSGYGFDKGWGLSAGMFRFFNSSIAADCGLVIGKNVQVLTDMDVANGGLFDPQTHAAKFDAVVLPFAEYVEAQEYLAYEQYVAQGGTLMMMSHSLEYPVTYNATTKMESLVYGHNWANNGTFASPIKCGSNTFTTECPWGKNNTDWTGSNSCMASCFHTYVYNGSLVKTDNPIGAALYTEFGSYVFRFYNAHEENSVTNMSDTHIVSVFVNDSRNLIASYTHQFRKGIVICFGIFGDDVIASDFSAQYFLLQGVGYGRLALPQLTTSTTSSSTASSMSTTSSSSSVTTVSSSSSLTSSTSTTSVVTYNPGPPSTPWVFWGFVALAVFVGISAVLLVRRRPTPGVAPTSGAKA